MVRNSKQNKTKQEERKLEAFHSPDKLVWLK